MTRAGTAQVLLALAATVCACGSYAAVQATDDAGVPVTLATPARRIVSLAPNATELLFAAGAGDRVVGVISISDWPPAAKSLPNVGDVHAIDLERILGLRPDLVVTWPYIVPAQVDRLRTRGIPIFTIDPKSIEGIAADMERLGVLAGTDAAARSASESFRRQLVQLSETPGRGPPVTVFYEIWSTPLYTIGGDHLITQAIAVCGGKNVFGSLPLPAPTVSVEAVLAAQPEAIVAGADGAARPTWLDDWKRWPTLPAVARDNLLVVDANLLHRDGPRFLEGVRQLCAALDVARRHR
jgi:iron complex transport system substrate-binding protein